MKKILFFFIVCFSTINILLAQATSKKNNFGLWNDANTWIGFFPQTDGVGNITYKNDITIDGYVTRDGDLLYGNVKPANTDIFVNDTLVINGNFIIAANGPSLNIGPEGVLVVFGNYSSGAQSNIANGGIFVVTGNLSVQNGAAGDYSGNGDIYVNGSTSGDADITGGNTPPNTSILEGGTQEEQELFDFIQAADPVNSPLPVTLVYFTTLKKDRSISLEWSTATEENTSHFELYKSSNGTDFTFLAEVEAKGKFTNEQLFYSFSDQAPFSGKNYYKLISVDFDGYREAFDIIRSDFEYQGMHAYPNPFDGQNLNFESFKEIGSIEVIISDINGRVRFRKSFSTDNHYQANLDDKLEKGMYFLKVTNTERKYSYSNKLIVR